jgi:fucose permease
MLVADFLRARSAGGRMFVQAIAAICAVPFVFLCGATRELTIAIAALFFWGLFKGFYDGNIWASLFDVVRPEARGRAVGLMNMVGWLGGGTAPVIIGKLAETLGLGGAISSAAYVYVAGAVLLMIAAKVFAPRDVARALTTS